MQSEHSDPFKTAVLAAETPEAVQAFKKAYPEILEASKSFWADGAASIFTNLNAAEGSLFTYTGDISPLYTSNIASGAGLYVDMILVPDPLPKICNIAAFAPGDQAVHFFIKHCLNILSYKELALASPNPIVAIVPDFYSLHDENYIQVVNDRATNDLLGFSNRTFGQNFKNYDEVQHFFKSLSTENDVKRTLVRPEEFVFNSDAKSIDEQASLQRSHAESPLGRVSWRKNLLICIWSASPGE